MTTIPAQDCDWNGDAMWFNCPSCRDRLCAAWFYSGGSCDNCGAEIHVQIVVDESKSVNYDPDEKETEA